jgi:hypothetical protein
MLLQCLQGDVPAIPEDDVTIDFTVAMEDTSRHSPDLQAATERAVPSMSDRLGGQVDEALGGGVGGPSGQPQGPAKSSFWQLSHYSHLFDVDTQVRG